MEIMKQHRLLLMQLSQTHAIHALVCTCLQSCVLIQYIEVAYHINRSKKNRDACRVRQVRKEREESNCQQLKVSVVQKRPFLLHRYSRSTEFTH